MREGQNDSAPTFGIYRAVGGRVIAFSGVLAGMVAAYEGTPAWDNALELSSRLGEPIVPLYGYDGEIPAMPPRSGVGDPGEDEIAEWLSRQIEDGAIKLEDIPRLMAKYAMTDPDVLRAEFAERMEMYREESASPCL